ncbi:MAG: glycoside hydrolase [Phycisphaerae bacterium]|jgi:polygalacturonase|nr:MAG: glycoside hydrolase [Phycisphaerae bacterium]
MKSTGNLTRWDWDITEYGAIADGEVLCTEAINRAIEACAEAGGGRVVIPPGTYLTGPIHLRSHVELHLCKGSIILFTTDYDEYPLVITNYEGLETIRCISPIWGEELQNVSITGDGIIDGQGEAWRPVKRFKMTDEQWNELLARGGVVDEHNLWWPTEQALAGQKLVHELQNSGKPLRVEDYEPARHYLRPNMVKLTRCRNVVIDGPTFRNSAAWEVHLLFCENVVIRNSKFLNPWYSSNGDGLDIDSCRNVRIEHSHFDCGDDAICIKSGKNEEGRRRGFPCENIIVDNCTVDHGHGGVTIGSEMSGGVRNVRVTNCIFRGTDIGLRFKTTRGRGGVVENVEISNVAMHNIKHEAISINMYYWVTTPVPEPRSERTPQFRQFTFRNITCDGAERALEIRGLPEMPVENMLFENMRIQARSGMLISDATDITLSRIRLTIDNFPSVQAHNVENLCMNDVKGVGPTEPLDGKLVGDL